MSTSFLRADKPWEAKFQRWILKQFNSPLSHFWQQRCCWKVLTRKWVCSKPYGLKVRHFHYTMLKRKTALNYHGAPFQALFLEELTVDMGNFQILLWRTSWLALWVKFIRNLVLPICLKPKKRGYFNILIVSYLYFLLLFLLPGKEEKCEGLYQGLLKTKSPSLPSRHTTGSSSPSTAHTTGLKQKRKGKKRSFQDACFTKQCQWQGSNCTTQSYTVNAVTVKNVRRIL